MNEKTGLEHYEKLYGDLNLAPDDAAKWIFLSGWNSAMSEARRRVNSMPFGNDTRASFAVYFQQMMVLDPEAVKEKPTPVQEPVAWRWTNGKGWLTYGEIPHDRFESTPLYTTPQPAPVQPVMTDEKGRPISFWGGKSVEPIKQPAPAVQEPVQGPSGDYLSDFQEGQWWLAELDAAVVNGTPAQRSAVAVVRNLLATVAANTTPPAQPAPVQPVAFEVGLVEWVGNKLMATPKVTTTPPASWMETVTANLVREGVNKHKARELAEHFYAKLKEKNT